MHGCDCRTCSSGLKTAIEVPSLSFHMPRAAVRTVESDKIPVSRLAALKKTMQVIFLFPTAAACAHIMQLSFECVMAVTKGIWITIR